jgi:hypothetical protein
MDCKMLSLMDMIQDRVQWQFLLLAMLNLPILLPGLVGSLKENTYVQFLIVRRGLDYSPSNSSLSSGRCIGFSK